MYQPHEYANLFPMMTPDERAGLVDDMKRNGYDTTAPIVIHEGKILDGRNRYEAAQAAGVDPVFSAFDGDDALAFVIRHNLKRRHLNESQRAVIAGRLANLQDGQRADKLSSSANLQSFVPVSQPKAAEMLNVSPRSVATVKAIEKAAPDLIPQIESGAMTANRAFTEMKRREVVSNLESVETQEAKAIEGVYDVIVIDPPWDMQKIERDVAPAQVAFEYPTMSLQEIADVKIPAADNCHVFLWTTQKYLPHAFGILAAWGLKYVCAFVWHKNGGFQAYGLPQYNCEFVLYARKGTPEFIDFKNFMTCFNAPRGAHSEKPEDFYSLLRRVTAGRRLDMFNRRKIEGFDGWGKESA
jgi:N6-adenosine-specific RNA methylase IME4